jgi:hypothetical protein
MRDDVLNHAGHPREDGAEIQRFGNRLQERLELVALATPFLFTCQQSFVFHPGLGIPRV